MDMRKQCVTSLSLGERGLGMRLHLTQKFAWSVFGYMEDTPSHITVKIGGRVLAQKLALAHGNTAMLHV